MADSEEDEASVRETRSREAPLKLEVTNPI